AGLRPCARAALPNPPDPARRRRESAGTNDASHRERRLVAGSLFPGARDALSSLRLRFFFVAAGPEDPVRGLRGMAAELVARRNSRASTHLLEVPPLRGPEGSRSRARPAPVDDPECARRTLPAADLRGADRRTQPAQPARRRHAVYDAPCN